MSVSGMRRRERLLSRSLQGVIGAVLLVGLATRNVSVLVNAVGALVVTVMPNVLERDYRLHLPPALVVWLTLAVTLHAVGMIGFYDDVWWWDHLTHLLSATVVASAGYATVWAIDEHTPALSSPPWFTALVVVLFTLALGVLWEVLEFAARRVAAVVGVRPVLVQYGLEDTLLDIVFDGAGALLVATVGARSPKLRAVADTIRRRLETR